MRCLITGGAGFIGSYLTGRALERGYEVAVLDNLSTGRLENLSDFEGRVEIIVGDVCDQDLVRRAAAGADIVLHHAALAEVPATVDDPLESARINDLGALGVFLACRDAGVRRVVYASSSAVYGNITTLPHVETMSPDPNNPYAAHKLLGEHYGAMFGPLYGLEVVSLRYFNVYGPRQNPLSPYSGVISIFMDRLSRGVQPIIYGDGRQSRDFIFVGDVAEAVFLAAETPGLSGEVFNVGTGRAATLLEVLEVLGRLSGLAPDPEFHPFRSGDVYESRAEVTLIRKRLGFSARTGLEEGLAASWDWYEKAKIVMSEAGRRPEAAVDRAGFAL